MPKSSAFHKTATARTLGTATFRTARRLAESSPAISETPVMVPRGWARLAAKPVAGERHDDRGGPGTLLGCGRRRVARGHDDIDVLCHQIVDKSGKTVGFSLSGPTFELDVLAFDIAKLREFFGHGWVENRGFERADRNESNARHFGRLGECTHRQRSKRRGDNGPPRDNHSRSLTGN